MQFVHLDDGEDGVWVLPVWSDALTIVARVDDDYRWDGFVAWTTGTVKRLPAPMPPELVQETVVAAFGAHPPTERWPAGSWAELLEWMAGRGEVLEVHCHEELWVGRVVEVGEDQVLISLIDPDGSTDPEPEPLGFDEFTHVSWGTAYARAMASMQVVRQRRQGEHLQLVSVDPDEGD